MPWKTSDVEKIKGGLTPEQQEKWVKIANGVYDSCMVDGNDEKCAKMAVMTANSKVGDEEMMDRVLISLETMLAENDVLREVKLLYPGEFEHALYGKFTVTEKDLNHAVENWQKNVGVVFDEDGSPILPFSYQHAGHDQDPEKAKAAGWIRKLFLKGSELWGSVAFTAKAKEYIANKEFLFQSPEFNHKWKDENGKEHGFTLRGSTLTNVPHLKKGQMAIALTDGDCLIMNSTNAPTADAREAGNGGNLNEGAMKMEKQLREMLKLKDDGDIVAAVKTLMEEKAVADARVVELTEKKPEPEKGTVVLTEAQFNLLNDGAKAGITAEKRLREMEAAGYVDGLINCEEPRLLPAQRDKSIAMYLADPIGFKEFMDKSSPVLSTKKNGSDGNAPDGGSEAVTKLTEEIKAYAAENKIQFTEAKRIMKAKDPVRFSALGY
jgi:phage I-like protein